jgi:predicted nucleic acid-binding protein
MGERYLVDTNAVIDYLNNKIHTAGIAFMNDIIDTIPNISVITKIELLRFNSPAEAYQIIKEFTEAAVIYDLVDPVVDSTIEICKAHKIKLPDAIIAATAIVNGFVLVSRNIADFKNIEGLQVVNPWETHK